MSKFVNIIRTALLAAAAIAASAPAFAETAPTASVAYGDLDLSTAAGQRHLHNRLAGAAREVCEGQTRSDTVVQTERTACMKQANAKADAQFAMLVSKSQPQVAVAETTDAVPAK